MRKARSAFTVLELVLVMGVLCVTAAVSVPLAHTLRGGTDLKAAADMVRARWADMKFRAVQEGQPYVFRALNKTGKFLVQRQDGGAAMPGQLPDGIVFNLQNSGSDSSDYADVLVIGATGTAGQDVDIGLQDGRRQINFHLDRSTGILTGGEKTLAD